MTCLEVAICWGSSGYSASQAAENYKRLACHVYSKFCGLCNTFDLLSSEECPCFKVTTPGIRMIPVNDVLQGPLHGYPSLPCSTLAAVACKTCGAQHAAVHKVNLNPHTDHSMTSLLHRTSSRLDPQASMKRGQYTPSHDMVLTQLRSQHVLACSETIMASVC